jgi:uncharacterized protein
MEWTSKILSFDWDDGNRTKNWTRHEVSWLECENVFFNDPLFVLPDPTHSKQKERFHALGHTNHGRLLFISFTVRKERIRVISAREMSRRERRAYSEQKEKHPKV